MICPKCNANLPEDSIFCPNCGCNIEETKKQMVLDQIVENKVQSTENTVITKNKINKVLVVFLVISVTVCCILGYFTFSFYTQNEEKTDIINGYENDIKRLKSSNDTLRKQNSEMAVGSEVLLNLKSYDKWGYATENFHSSTGVLVLNKNGGPKSFNIITTYNTTLWMDNSNSLKINAEWDDNWNENITEVHVTPKSKGISVLTFTNDAYDTSFKVLVIVT